MLESAVLALLDRNIPAPQPHVLLDSTVAAVYAQLKISVSVEIECPELPEAMQSDELRREKLRRQAAGFQPEDRWYWWRRLILHAVRDTALDGPAPSEDVDATEIWAALIDRLAQRVLARLTWDNERKLARARAIATLGSAATPTYFSVPMAAPDLIPVGCIDHTMRRIERSLGDELDQAIRRRPPTNET